MATRGPDRIARQWIRHIVIFAVREAVKSGSSGSSKPGQTRQGKRQELRQRLRHREEVKKSQMAGR